LIVPSIEKPYIVRNDCADSVTVKTAAGTGITVPAGKTMWVYTDGTNVVDAVTHLSSLTLDTDLAVAQGGTGASTFTSNGVLLGNGTSAITATAAGTTGQVLVGNTGGAPTWATLTGTAVTSISFGTTGLTPSTATQGAVTVAGTLGVANGGTGTATAFTAGSVVFAGASGVYSQDNANLFWDNANDRLGIGTSSPAAKLQVVGNMQVVGTSGVASTTLISAISGLSNGYEIVQSAANALTYNWRKGDNTVAMTLDSAGNVGIGTTSPAQRLDVFDGLMRVGGSSQGKLLAYSSSNTHVMDLGVSTGTGSGADVGLYNLISGNLTFGTNSAERMRITSAGNVGIGTSSPTAKLDVNGSVNGAGNAQFTNAAYCFVGATSNAVQGQLAANGGSGTVDIRAVSNHAVTIFTNNTERMRIDSSGNVIVGGTTAQGTAAGRGNITINGSSTSILSFSNGGSLAGYVLHDGTDLWVNNVGAGAQRFYTNGTERMRIASGGDLLVGTTDPGPSSGQGVKLLPTGRVYSVITSSIADSYDLYNTTAAAYRFYVDSAGTIFATSTTISAISDIRLKENVRDLDAGLDTILALKPRRFDWKEGKGKDVKDDMGFIAQEVEEVLPALIGGWKAGEGEPEDLKSVKAGDLIPVLVKAIQELTARVAQLEGN
jgi:hypothetical protein